MDATDHGNAALQEPLEITIGTARELASARAALRSWLRSGIPEEHAEDIVLASGEALANALEHGRTPITVCIEWSEGTLHVSVRDAGSWRVSAEPERGTRPRGLGIPIMTALTDSLTFDTTDGTIVRLSRQFRT